VEFRCICGAAVACGGGRARRLVKVRVCVCDLLLVRCGSQTGEDRVVAVFYTSSCNTSQGV